jgi:hypothetical protein
MRLMRNSQDLAGFLTSGLETKIDFTTGSSPAALKWCSDPVEMNETSYEETAANFALPA